MTIPGVAAPCVCRGQICGESTLGPLLYRCATCRRLVPWCFGAADDRPDDCDDCWAAAVLADEIKRGVRR